MKRWLALGAFALVLAGCISVYIINASPEAEMERGPAGVRTQLEHNKVPSEKP